MSIISDPEFTSKQIEALKIIKKCRHVLLEGGSRSGKTLLNVYCIFTRAWAYPKTDHLIVRNTFADAKLSVAMQTIPALGALQGGIDYESWLNKTDYIYKLPNGSRIFVGGTADKDKVDKLLSREYATIYVCETSEISFHTIEILETRLNPPKKIRGLFLMDQNPTSTSFWTNKVFHERKYPDGRPVPEKDYGTLRMNPSDNPHLSDEYLNGLKNLSARKRERFYYGNYQADSGTLWNRGSIRYKNISTSAAERIVIGVDPSGSIDGDEIGIISAGRSIGEFFVMNDFSIHGTPNEWAKKIDDAYNDITADAVIVETNYGGDMVEYTLRTVNPYMNIIRVTSTRGKILRAEPISALYEQKKVYHTAEFPQLENEMCTYTGAPGEKSPNRLDALVFALSELSGNSFGMSSSSGIRGILTER